MATLLNLLTMSWTQLPLLDTCQTMRITVCIIMQCPHNAMSTLHPSQWDFVSIVLRLRQALFFCFDSKGIQYLALRLRICCFHFGVEPSTESHNSFRCIEIMKLFSCKDFPYFSRRFSSFDACGLLRQIAVCCTPLLLLLCAIAGFFIGIVAAAVGLAWCAS